MDYSTLLFSFTGRINRAKYWLGVGLLIAYWIVVGIVLSIFFYSLGSAGYILALAAGAAATIGGLWAGLAIGVKRLHDRDKSGWWLLLFWLLPGILSGIGTAAGGGVLGMLFNLGSFAISIWGFVEIGCLRGTEGANQYGADPLPPQA
jgi:uncharacterized membrane protein YhaH (DUF805 family)